MKLFDNVAVLVSETRNRIVTVKKASVSYVSVEMGGSGDKCTSLILIIDGVSKELVVENAAALRFQEWWLGMRVPPPEILAIEDKDAYESAYAAWLENV